MTDHDVEELLRLLRSIEQWLEVAARHVVKLVELGAAAQPVCGKCDHPAPGHELWCSRRSS